MLEETVPWTFNFSSFPSFEWDCLVVDATKMDDTILGYDFLHYWNPDIDWNQGMINLRASLSSDPSTSASLALMELNSLPPTACSGSSSSLPGALQALEYLSPSSVVKIMEPVDLFEDFEVRIRVLTTGSKEAVFESDYFDEPPNDLQSILPTIPEEYHEFASLFSKILADTLPPRRDCDHKIELDGPVPKKGPIYKLSEPKDLILREYISENVSRGFIHPSTSATGAPVLFAPKTDGSL